MYYTEPRSPSAADLQLIEGAAHVAMIAIQRDRSQRALEHAYQDLKQSEEKLRQDQRELRQLIDFLPQHVFVLDSDGRLLQANQVVLD